MRTRNKENQKRTQRSLHKPMMMMTKKYSQVYKMYMKKGKEETGMPHQFFKPDTLQRVIS